MSLPQLIRAFRDLPEFKELESALRIPRAEARLVVPNGSAGAALLAALSEAQPSQRFLVIAPGPSEAERWLADLANLLPDDRVALYPQREGLGEEEPHVEIAGERIETLEALSRGGLQVIVTTARATLERTPMPATLAAARLEIHKGVPFREVVARLQDLGYERVPQVTDVAQFAVRGGIVDVYGYGMALPARAEYWGDELAALRAFDLGTQRGAGELERVTVLPVRAGNRESGIGNRGNLKDPGPDSPFPIPDSRSTLLQLLPATALLIEDSASAFEEEVERAWSDADHHAQLARRMGEDVPPRSDLFISPDDWRAMRGRFARLSLGAGDPTHSLPIGPPPEIHRDLSRLAPPTRGGLCLVLCDNEGQLERLDELLQEGRRKAAEGVVLAIGSLDGGFVLPGMVVLTDHQIFRRARRLRRPRRYRQSPPASLGGTLQNGDWVVHLEHGIGIYRGIQTITVQDATIEVAAIEYEGGDLLHVPLYRIDQLERFRSAETEDGERAPPKLHKLGGGKWKKLRAQAEAEVRRMAAELLDLYARRQVTTGFAFPPDTRWQRELESSFLYEDTPDQRRATTEVKADMEKPRPMDRLVVGDVGYGKTEIAVRAAFKAVEAGKQVVILAPTTILVEQHLRTFSERFADYPVRLAALSRLHTPKEVAATLAAIAGGTVDVLIGTHRLLSPDVVFKDLGLVVVDEEHRFGVDHKERLKKLRLAVDVLTMTATPIPRTLQLSLAGLRDLTLIETPPRDRSPVLTSVEPWDDALIEEAMARELDRGGQVYVVHNRIETLETIAERIRQLAPRATVAHAHGQMRPKALDEVMRGFVDGDVHILVSTMIVESGLDVPNANTMIVHHAEYFGLAQLYQLRGRVGRSHRRAHCYLIVPDTIDRQAEARLMTLAHHTELGAGYRIALKDLELRGAGNILGIEQSGFAMTVGVDMYLRMLEDTVKSLQTGGGGREALWAPPEVLLERSAYLPDSYVSDDAAKLDLYRRLARSQSPGEISGLREELADRFGRLPPEAEALVALTQLRVIGARLGLETVVAKGDEARLVFRNGAAPRLARLTVAMDEVQFAAEVRRTQPLVLRLQRLGGIDLLAGLVRALARAAADPNS